MAVPDDIPAAAAGSAGLAARRVRALQIAVVAINVLVLIGLIAVFSRMFYLSSQPGGKAAWVPEARLPLPAGAAVRNVSLSGDRLLVHYDAAAVGASGIVIFELATGKVLSRVELVPGPRRE